MKRRAEFICQLLGIFWVPMLVIVLIVAPMFFMGCTSSDIRALMWPGPPFPGGSGKLYAEHIDPQYQHVSPSAPEGLKGFYDPKLTQDLNR